MKKLILFPIIALLFMLFISCEKDQVEPVTSFDTQEEMATTRANATVPFKASYTTHPVLYDPEVDEFNCSDDPPHYFIPGEGKATHLGKSTMYSETRIFPVDDEQDFSTTWYATQTGCVVFTGADGSTLEGNYCGSVTFWGLDTPEGDLLYAQGKGWYVIYGGTGRFENASGCGTYSYDVDREGADIPGEMLAHLEFVGLLGLNGNTVDDCEDVVCVY